jgi:RecA-family ATPase
MVQAQHFTAPPVEWLIPNLIPTGMLTVLSGRDGLGKTLLALEIAQAVLLGRPLFSHPEFPTRPGGVFACLFDDAASLTAHRLSLMGIRHHPAFWIPQQFDLAEPSETWRDLEPLIREHRPRLVIVDALYMITPATPGAGNDAAVMRPVLECLDQLAQRTNTALILIAHDRKAGDDVAGSFVVQAVAKMILRLHLPASANDGDPDEGPTTHERILKIQKNKQGDKTAYRLTLNGPGDWAFQGSQRAWRERTEADRDQNLRERIMRFIDTRPDVLVPERDVLDAMRQRASAVRAQLHHLVGTQSLEHPPGGYRRPIVTDESGSPRPRRQRMPSPPSA